MSKPEVFPIWTVEERIPVINSKNKKKTKEIQQKVKTKIIGLRQSETKSFISPDLLFSGLSNSVWYLKVDPRTKPIDSDQYCLGVCLHLKTKQFERLCGQMAMFKITLIDTKRGKAWSKSSQPLFFNSKSGWGWKDFIKRSDVFDNCKRSLDLIILLTITSIQLRDSIENIRGLLDHCWDDTNDRIDEFKFIHDLLNDREYCDVQFVVEDVELAAHSKLLASKSPVFRKLFAKQNNISVTGIDWIVFYELILFLYNGFCPNIEKYCQKLLIAANYYQISDLKSICDNLCFRDLSPKEAIAGLIFAEKHQTFSSKLRTLCYIALNLNEIMDSFPENWKQFQTNNENLFKEVLEISNMKCQCLRH